MPNKKNEEIENLNIEDADVKLEIENLDFDGEIKDVSAPSTNTGSEGISTTSSTNNEVVHSNDAVSSPMESADNSSSSTASSDLSSTSSPVNTENSDAVIPTENNVPNTDMADFAGDRASKESLKDKADRIRNAPENIRNNINDTKDRINNAKDRIKNAPDDIKNKVNDTKDKFNNAKDKAKEVPDNLRKKRDAVKDKWDNRPKSMNEAKDRAKNGLKNSGKNIKARAKQGAKNVANKAKDKAIDTAKESELGQKVQNVANKIEKAKEAKLKIKKLAVILKNPVVLGIIVGLLLVLVLIIIVPSMFANGSPLIGGEVEDEENYSKYSEVDQKTIENLKKIYANNPNGDPAYAMAATLYPYIEEMQNGNVSSLRGKTNVEQEDSEATEDDPDEEVTGEGIDEDAEDNQNDLTDDDPYLELLRQRKYLKKFKKLLKKSTKNEDDPTQDPLTTYLKDTWFDKDKGYKELFDGVDKKDELKEAIIDDLISQISDFEGYFFENCNTSNATTTALNSAGNINDEIKGDIYIRLRDYKDNGNEAWISSEHYAAPILYGTDTNPLTFARYIMGVVYAEIGDGVKTESRAKTIMITAKSFTIGRHKSMGKYYPKPEYDETNNRTIIEMRGNVGDQDFCDVYEGCASGTYAWSTRKEMSGSGRPKPALSKADIANLEKWWNEIADQYVVNKESGNFAGNQYSDYNRKCKKGKCVSQNRVAKASETQSDYMNILFNANNGGFDNSKYTLYTATTGELYAVTTGNKVCSNDSITGSRQSVVDFAVSMVGKIPYYFYEGQSDGYGALGHALAKEFDSNHFGELASLTDHKGRNKYGLDCSGFVDFVFWNALNDNLGNGNTDTLKSKSTKIEYSELKPGDLGFLNDGSSGTEQHVGIYIGNDEWVELNPSGVTKGPYPNFKVYYRLNILSDLDSKESSDKTDSETTTESNNKTSDVSSGESTGKLQSPIKGKKPTCKDYPNYSNGSYHGGTDIVVKVGTDVMAMDGGVVITSKDITSGDCTGNRNCNGGYYSYGRVIEIKHDNGITTKYAHLSKRLVKKGDKVSKGQVIAKSGNTGNSTGPHLHIEITKSGRNQSPCNYIK